jgi:hypothetical protein
MLALHPRLASFPGRFTRLPRRAAHGGLAPRIRLRSSSQPSSFRAPRRAPTWTRPRRRARGGGGLRLKYSPRSDLLPALLGGARGRLSRDVARLVLPWRGEPSLFLCTPGRGHLRPATAPGLAVFRDEAGGGSGRRQAAEWKGARRHLCVRPCAGQRRAQTSSRRGEIRALSHYYLVTSLLKTPFRFILLVLAAVFGPWPPAARPFPLVSLASPGAQISIVTRPLSVPLSRLVHRGQPGRPR